MTPGQCAVAEGSSDGGEHVEPFDDTGEVLELAPGHAETLARVVIDPDEPQMLVRAPVKEGPGETAKHAATERLLAREAAQQRVKQLGAKRAMELETFIALARWNEWSQARLASTP